MISELDRDAQTQLYRHGHADVHAPDGTMEVAASIMHIPSSTQSFSSCLRSGLSLTTEGPHLMLSKTRPLCPANVGCRLKGKPIPSRPRMWVNSSSVSEGALNIPLPIGKQPSRY